MVDWIVAAVVLVVVVVIWRLLRGLWKESHAQVDALPPATARRDWPVPRDIGDRVMWCPILARRVILADTQLDEGDIGTVVAFDGRQPIISFDDFEHTHKRTPAPTRRTTPKKKRP
jgi:hypothetical protein